MEKSSLFAFRQCDISILKFIIRLIECKKSYELCKGKCTFNIFPAQKKIQ